MAFIFYDTETTGADRCFDQILQFAAVLTDDGLNVVDSFEIRSRLLPHIAPHQAQWSSPACALISCSICNSRRTTKCALEFMRS